MAFDLLWIAIAFLVIGLIAYALGARGLGGFSASIGKTILWIFVIIFVILLIVRFIT